MNIKQELPINGQIREKEVQLIGANGEKLGVMSTKEALEKAEKINKHRAAYYNFYTDKEWGDSASYHLSIDSSILGSEETAFFIKRFIELKLEQSK